MKTITHTAIDIGSHSIIGVVARKHLNTGEIEVLAQVKVPSFGVRGGEVVKPQEVAQLIEQVKQKLSTKSGIKIKNVLVNVGGNHIYSMPSSGLVSVSRADQRISKEDIQRVLRAAGAINLPSNKEVLHIIPQEYIVDNEKGIKEPLGLKGIRLEAKVLLPCLFSPVLENLDKAVALANLQTLDFIISPQAASKAVLSPEQKEVGVAVIDIGSSTTTLSVFEKGDLIDFNIFPIGSANITNDIAICLRTEIATAERIKKEFGSLMAQNEAKKKMEDDEVKLPEKDLVFSKKFLNNIVQARISDIFSETSKSLKKISGGQPLPAGVILTGGGSKMPGIVEFAKDKLELPCRQGVSIYIPALDDPELSTCTGILLTAFGNGHSTGSEINQDLAIKNISSRIKRILKLFVP